MKNSHSPNESVSSAELREFEQIARRAAVEGGRILQEWIGQFTVREKSRANLVTEADEASQKAIQTIIASRFPDHGFLGEEGLDQRSETSEYRWVIDPLDGTSNYVHGFPYYAVSIALQRGSELLVGVIFDPNRDEMFSAVAGHGATLNDSPIETSGEQEVGSAMGMASLPVGGDSSNPAVQRFLKAMNHLQTVQRTGSAALNLASVACGRIDVFWSTSLNPWDVAAGVLLVQEAGGIVTDMTGGPVDIQVSSLIAACSGRIQKDVSDILK